ncbi:MAG: hypothetical protein ABDH61_04700 [Acidilobaceae archaeon]
MTKGVGVFKLGDKEVPEISVIWGFSFAGKTTGIHANFINPDVGDVITTIQESKAWMGKVRKAR